jgi:hypothetical protein
VIPIIYIWLQSFQKIQPGMRTMPRPLPAVRRAEALDALQTVYPIVTRLLGRKLHPRTRKEVLAIAVVIAPLVTRISGRRIR